MLILLFLAGVASAAETKIVNPLIEQRADPWMYKHTDGFYYFIATVPAFDLIELRRSKTIAGLANAKPKVIWRKHDEGLMSRNIWAPEIHYVNGKWYVYFAAGELNKGGSIRMFALENAAPNPLNKGWVEKGEIKTKFDTFSLDATSFEHKGKRYLVWAQTDPEFGPNTSLFIAEMDTPWSIKQPQVNITDPVYLWETVGYRVNEGAAVIKRNGKIFISYSASATDHNYCMGLLAAEENADLLNRDSWWKSPVPVFMSSPPNSQYGPGHNSFTVADDGKTDLLVYHARNYQAIEGNPLNNGDRHTRVQQLYWRADGFPDFREPVKDGPLMLPAVK